MAGEGQLLHQKASGASDYRSAVRGAVRGLWSGAMGQLEFVNAMRSAMERRFLQAWNEGARANGIKPDEMSDAERLRLRMEINSELPFVYGFAADIAAGSKLNGGKLTPLLTRAEMWANRYESIRQLAEVVTGGDKKVAWTLGEAEHCGSCLKLAGKIKRLSYWSDVGIVPAQPGVEYLECAGYNCACSLQPTEAPMSKGPLPRLP